MSAETSGPEAFPKQATPHGGLKPENAPTVDTPQLEDGALPLPPPDGFPVVLGQLPPCDAPPLPLPLPLPPRPPPPPPLPLLPPRPTPLPPPPPPPRPPPPPLPPFPMTRSVVSELMPRFAVRGWAWVVMGAMGILLFGCRHSFSKQALGQSKNRDSPPILWCKHPS
jgi:hypothetical protein